MPRAQGYGDSRLDGGGVRAGGGGRPVGGAAASGRAGGSSGGMGVRQGGGGPGSNSFDDRSRSSGGATSSFATSAGMATAASQLSKADVRRLVSQADKLRDVLGRSKNVSEEMISILGTFDERLSMLETAMRPIQARTLAFRKAHANIDATLHVVEGVLEKFDVPLQVEQRIKDGPRRDLDAYLQAVDQLKEALGFFDAHRSYRSSEGAGQHARALMKDAMQMLEADFRQLLANNSKAIDPTKLFEAMPGYDADGATATPTPERAPTGAPAVDVDGAAAAAGAGGKSEKKPWPPLLLPTLVERLHAVAQRMIQNGAAGACTRVYREVRGNTLEQTLRRLGVEVVTRDDILKMSWEELESKIGNWIQFIKIAMVLVFPEERKLCYQVFKGLDPHREICFAEMGDRALSLLLSFGEAIASSQRSPEKLFVLLDMYETIRDIVPLAAEAFPGNACIPCREYLRSLQRSLAEVARDTFSEFEDAVDKDSTKTPVADGTVHPLTSYVINYVKFLFDYNTTLQQLFEEVEKDHVPAAMLANADADAAARMRGSSSSGNKPRLEQATLRILTVLENNLEAKAKLYKDLSLTQLFLMNNKHYIVRSIRKSDQALQLVGDDWVQRHRKIVFQHQAMYQKLAWSKVVSAVGGPSDPVNKNTLKEKLKSFNVAFEEQHAKQLQWTIPDAELQAVVRQAVIDAIVPPYADLLKRYGAFLDSAKKHLKYQPADVERMVRELFDGRSAAAEGNAVSRTKSRFGGN